MTSSLSRLFALHGRQRAQSAVCGHGCSGTTGRHVYAVACQRIQKQPSRRLHRPVKSVSNRMPSGLTAIGHKRALTAWTACL